MASQPSDSFNLVARLELLDGRVRRLKQVLTYVLIFFGILLVLLIIGVLRVRSEAGDGDSFTLRDQDGKRRANLVVTKGAPVLAFYDDNEQLLGGLTMAQENGNFRFLDRDQKLRGQVGMIDGQPGCLLFDSNGKPRAALFLDKTGAPHLVLKDEKGKTFFSQPPQR